MKKSKKCAKKSFVDTKNVDFLKVAVNGNMFPLKSKIDFNGNLTATFKKSTFFVSTKDFFGHFFNFSLKNQLFLVFMRKDDIFHEF